MKLKQITNENINHRGTEDTEEKNYKETKRARKKLSVFSVSPWLKN